MLAAIAANRLSEEEEAEERHLQSLLSKKPCCVFPTKIVILLLVAFLYLLVGGALFSSLELQNERDAQRSVRSLPTGSGLGLRGRTPHGASAAGACSTTMSLRALSQRPA
jgi:hypothetical protein